jgi:hypothetical protein
MFNKKKQQGNENPRRELTEEESRALEMALRVGLERNKVERGEIQVDEIKGKHAEELRERAYNMMREKNINPNDVDSKTIEDWIEDQIKNPSAYRMKVRLRNQRLLRDFGKGGRFEGRKLDPRALFKGDELEQVAAEPGGVREALEMKQSIPIAVNYLRFLQKEGHETFSGLEYDKVNY